MRDPLCHFTTHKEITNILYFLYKENKTILFFMIFINKLLNSVIVQKWLTIHSFYSLINSVNLVYNLLPGTIFRVKYSKISFMPGLPSPNSESRKGKVD